MTQELRAVPPLRPGWFGLRRELLHALATFGCDRAPDGRFIVRGHVWSGLDEEELVVPGDAEAFIDGKPVSIAGLMSQTSYGLRGVTVIC